MTWFTTNGTACVMVLLTTVCIYLTVIFLTRLTGLRSFSKMSGFDFVVTVAIGAVIAQVITAPNPPLLLAITALAGLFLLQVIVAYLRGRSTRFSTYVDNQPLLLMKGSEFLEDNMKKARITREDLLQKLRGANVNRLEQVNAVIFERTGDVSILSDVNQGQDIDQVVVENVDGGEALK